MDSELEETPTELSVSPDKLDSFLRPIFSIEVTDSGFLRDMETGEILTSDDGEELTVDEIGYLKSGENGEVVPIKDSFPEIVSGLSSRDFRED